MYGTPTVSVTGASRDSDGREEVDAGSNGRINLAVDEMLWFEAESGEPLHPGAIGETKAYQWTNVAGEWSGKPKRVDTRKDFSWSSAGEYTLYCRMVDGNDVATEPNSILVRVWDRPTVESAPPREEIDAGRVSWYGGKFAGWVGEPVELGASARTNNGSSGEEIVDYLWDPDAGGPEELLQRGVESIALSADEIEVGETEIDIGRLGIGQGDYTLEAVIQLDDNLSNRTRCGIILGNYPEPGSTGWEIYSGGKLRLYWNGGHPDAKNLGPDLRDGREHHVAFVRNAESHLVYVDGQQVAQAERGSDVDFSGLHLVGSDYRSSPLPFHGSLSYLKVSAAALSPEAFSTSKGVAYTWNSANLNGRISCVAVTNFGIESHPREFDLVVYETLEPDAGGPYVGRPNSPLILSGELDENRYPGAVYEYEWRFERLDGVRRVEGTASGKEVEYQSNAVGTDSTFKTWFSVEVTTAEGLNAAAVDSTVIALEAGKPVAQPGGPYRGGIAGGSFSPVQFLGNDPREQGAEDIGYITDWEWQFGGGEGKTGVWNPTHAFSEAGTYVCSLKVKSQYGKWSQTASVEVEVIDGQISGYVRAADLRTPVRDVNLTLTSSHVDKSVLGRIAAGDSLIRTTSEGGLSTRTNEDGFYTFDRIPLGSYRLVASKIDGKTVHEFETAVVATELTLDSPVQRAMNFVDLSVYPISGRIVYSIQKNGEDVFVEDAVIKAQPVSSTSGIESLPSAKSPNSTGTNYSLPLFAGKYLFKAERGGHDIRLVGTHPDDGRESPAGYDPGSQLVTIEKAATDLDFIDFTERELIVYVEDSGGYPIFANADGDTILVRVAGDNGFAEGKVWEDGGRTLFRAVVPPGNYTVSLANVPTAVSKENKGQKVAEVELLGEEVRNVTMVVPVPIALEIGPPPRLFGGADSFLAELGLDPENNPEGYMVYFPPDPQEHTYTIKATANGYGVSGFTLKVVDNISQVVASPAYEQTYPAPNSRYTTDSDENGLYTVKAGLPNRTTVNDSDPDSYLEFTLADSSTVVKVPRVLPKRITFQASKEGYEDSDIYTEEVIVLGEVPEGSAAEMVAVPNVNYLVLHDPPGDGSYSYLDDAMVLKGVVVDMRATLGDVEVPVYPSPWSEEREIDDVDFDNLQTSTHDLGKKGLLEYRDPSSATTTFAIASIAEIAIGVGSALLPAPGGFAAQLVKLGAMVVLMNTELAVQYEVSPSRHLETPLEGDLPDLLGPGKGDIYYGEGWTLGLQTKYRLGIQPNPDSAPGASQWIPHTELVLTYDILERNNQYLYTVRDIENIIGNLETQVAGIDTVDGTKKTQRDSLEGAIGTWEKLLEGNPAYVWQRDHIRGEDGKGRGDLEDFLKTAGLGKTDDSELLVFSGGGAQFEYARTVKEASLVEYSTVVEHSSSATLKSEFGTGTLGVGSLGPIAKLEFSMGFEGDFTVGTGHSLGASWESGQEAEQTVGFVLADDDVGDNISTYVYEGPWGTPIFFTDPGSVTSDPWQAGTNKAVDVQLSMLSESDWGPFDYRDGAHYQFRVTSTGKRKLEGSGVDFIFYDLPMDNERGATVRFNGSDEAPYSMELFRGFSDPILQPSAVINVSVYPPEMDWDGGEEWEYPVLVQAENAEDYQIAVSSWLYPRFADLRGPRATVTAPYDGQRISPEVFKGDEKFAIRAFCDDEDVAQIRLEIRSKRTDGVWEAWRSLPGMVWVDTLDNENVTVVTHTGRDPVRREFVFEWTGEEIASLGVGEYSLRAVAADRATRLNADGRQEPAPNVDLDAPVVSFVVDGSKPSVLTTLPDYQSRERERIYRGELSAIFTDDMRADDFSDRTFYVTDLLEGEKVAGFVSYSPALRKATFVPVQPFRPNGFFQVEIRTDKGLVDGSVEKGVHDLAGNPLDNLFMWTFRTTDAPFEETWSIGLSVTDGAARDGNNIAGVAFGAEEAEDEQDARAVPGMADQLRLNFLDVDEVEFERDVRPADGRLSHHWFFVVENAAEDATVTLEWLPSIKLTRNDRAYRIVQLTEFDAEGRVASVVTLDPSQAEFDLDTGAIGELVAYSYQNSGSRSSGGRRFEFDVNARYFRLDVQKSVFVATTLARGTSGWRFLSVPIAPERSEPFVNLGDDIEDENESFKLYQYNTRLGEYRIYPLDLGEVGLEGGRGYFTRFGEDAEVDVGGALNQEEVTVLLEGAGWHAIGNPFIDPVGVGSLRLRSGSRLLSFEEAVARDWVEGTLYRWDVASAEEVFMSGGGTADGYAAVAEGGFLEPWEGYWLKSYEEGLELVIPVPDDLSTFPSTPGYLFPNMKPIAAAAGEFYLELALLSDAAADRTTALGAHPGAREGYDLHDRSEPPTLSKTVAAFFEHPEWGVRAGRFDRDVRPVLEAGAESCWELVVFTDRKGEELTLSWAEGVAGVPADIQLEIRSVDEGGVWLDMREVPSLPVPAETRIVQKRFEVRARRLVIPETALLPSFPNPSNPEVWIPFELAAEAPVAIGIYNVTGQQVRRLDLGIRSRGQYSSRSQAAHWDGREESGEPVSSGVYFTVLRAGDFTATRKMTILR